MLKILKKIELPDVPDEILHHLYEEKKDELDELQEKYFWTGMRVFVLVTLLPIAWGQTIHHFETISMFPLIMIISVLAPLSIYWLVSLLSCYKLTVKQIQIDVLRLKFIERDPKIAEKISQKASIPVLWNKISSFAPLAKSTQLSLATFFPLFFGFMLIGFPREYEPSLAEAFGFLISSGWIYLLFLGVNRMFLSRLMRRLSQAKEKG